jgi:hypothetical protein
MLVTEGTVVKVKRRGIRDGQVIFKDRGPVRVMVTEAHVGATTEPTLRDLSEALVAVFGTDYGVHSPTSISRFTDMSRQVAALHDARPVLIKRPSQQRPPEGGHYTRT